MYSIGFKAISLSYCDAFHRACKSFILNTSFARCLFTLQVKVVANLPYNITKEFLKAMLPMGDHVSELSIMIQEEVARRLVNKKPGVL